MENSDRIWNSVGFRVGGVDMEIAGFDGSFGKKEEEERIYFLCPTSSGKSMTGV